MIVRWWEKWVKFRASAWRKLAPVVETRWYKLLFSAAMIAVVVKFVDAQRGPDFPTFIRRIPVQAFTLPMLIISLPMISEYYEYLRQRNRKMYDPDRLEIKQMAHRAALIGWVFIATSVVWLAGGLTFLFVGVSLPMWGAVGPFPILLTIGIMQILRSNEMRSGTWTPPEWMPPMDSIGQSNDLDRTE